MYKKNSRVSCFKEYDLRGKVGSQLTKEIVYRVARASATILRTKVVAIGYDVRASSISLARAASKGFVDSGVRVLDLGMVGTEEMYWAVANFNTCAGIQITASHNPKEYNGMKIVKSQAKPLCKEREFEKIHSLVKEKGFSPGKKNGSITDVSVIARSSYVQKVLSFVNLANLRPLKIVINAGHGTAGPTFDNLKLALEDQGVFADFLCMYHNPDPNFPIGVPNPQIRSSQYRISNVIIENKADFGVAFDCDFDRCFVFDENGKFVHSSHLACLLAKKFLLKDPSASIVRDSKVVWSLHDIIEDNNGKAKVSKTGHANFKESMRRFSSIYGVEVSGHHYFRDFNYCDSGMIPWLILWEEISKIGVPLSHLVNENSSEIQISDEISFKVSNWKKTVETVLEHYRSDAVHIENFDGISLEFEDWRFNLRPSSTEPLVRLNLECIKHKQDLGNLTTELMELLT